MKITDITHPLYFAVNPQGATVTSRAHGIDISKYDQYFLPETAVNQLDFVVQRASYRKTKDQAFDTLLPGVLQVPIRLAYHYYNIGYSGDGTWQEQVNFFYGIIKNIPYHGTAWDFEGSYNILSTQAAVNSYYAIKELEQKTGKPCFLYTSPSLYNQYIYPTIKSHGLNWNGIPLWLAQWFFTPNPNGTPSTPNGRGGLSNPWDMWQYTDKGDGTKYGVARPTACDLDVYNGTVEQMKSRLNIGTTPTEPDPGGTMFWAEIITGGLNLREGVGTGYAIVMQMKLGDIVKCSGRKNPGGGWWEIIEHNGTPVLGWASSGANGEYMKVIPAPAPIVVITSVTVNYTENGVAKSETLP